MWLGSNCTRTVESAHPHLPLRAVQNGHFGTSRIGQVTARHTKAFPSILRRASSRSSSKRSLVGLVIIPIIIFAWNSMETVSAAILTAYMVPVIFLDSVLKPIVMGRGLPIPMLVIFIGVIGGTMAHGLIGLFVGPIVLSLGYELGRAWIAMGRVSSES